MPTQKFITTSWDDGHPLDFRLAELLDKYKLQATFYIPRANPEHIVMNEDQVAALSERFEIGGHTLNHVRLTRSQRNNFDHEIKGCFDWLRSVTGTAPVSFCFPNGYFDNYAVDCAKEAGYKLFRTTELLSVNYDDSILSTTLQMYEHTRLTYIKHLLKRGKVQNLIQWTRSNSETNLLKLTDYYIDIIRQKGSGCLHLWGHSWEMDEFAVWSKLEQVFKHLSQCEDFTFVPNKGLL